MIPIHRSNGNPTEQTGSNFLCHELKAQLDSSGLINEHILLILDDQGNILSFSNVKSDANQESGLIGKHFSIVFNQDEIQKGIPQNLLVQATQNTNFRYCSHFHCDGKEYAAEYNIHQISKEPIKICKYVLNIHFYIEDENFHRAIDLISLFNQTSQNLLNEKSVCRKFCELLQNPGGYDRLWIAYANHDSHKSIKPFVQIGLDRKKLTALKLSWETKENKLLHPVEKAISSGQPVIINDLLSEDSCSQWNISSGQEEFASIVSIPITIQEKIIGAVNLYGQTTFAFSQNEINLLKTLVSQLSSAIDKSRCINQHQKNIAELRENEKRFTHALSQANDGLWDWNIEKNQIYYSQRWKSLLGFNEDEIGDSPDEWLSRVHLEDRYQLEVDLTPHINGLLSKFESEHRILHKDGTYHWFLSRALSIWDTEQKTQRIFGTITDITDKKMMEDRLKHEAMHDPLTGLPNRSYFIDQMIRAIERTKRQTKTLSAVLIIDIDRFNIINDSLGHDFGDLMLVEIAKRIKTCLRASDISSRVGEIISRFGGDEFGILVDGIKDVSDTTRISTRLQTELSEPINMHGHEIFISVSIGIAIITKNYNGAQDLLRDAETALYRAKAGGRARYQIFDTDMHDQSLALLQMETDLRRAVERSEFYLLFQPILSLANRDVIKTEALLRWKKPGQIIPPSDFIPLAEETGLIVPLGEWVLRTACHQAKEWYTNGINLQMAVNISAKQLQEHNFPYVVQDILNETQLEPQALQLEITESAAMQDLNLSIKILHDLQNIGVTIAIDDFGTSYSSLSYLKDFPVNNLKIDKSFIDHVHQNENDAALTTAIIALGHYLNLYVTAEGVETKYQLQFLSSQYCDEIQGYFISHPLPGEVMTERLHNKFQWLEDNSLIKKTASDYF